MSAKAELNDLQYEQQREMEGLLDSIRSLTRELKLQETIIDAFIPRQYQVLLLFIIVRRLPYLPEYKLYIIRKTLKDRKQTNKYGRGQSGTYLRLTRARPARG